jgi:hypothetical protein
MIDWKNMKTGIYVLIVLVFCTGCMQENIVTGVYLNEAHNIQYITFGYGIFSHTYYNNTPAIITGTFKENNTVLTLYYKDGETIEYYTSDNGAELIPVNENSSLPLIIKMENRFAKRMKQ